MYQVLLIIFLLVAVSLVALIMLQQGKGADRGSSFNKGISSTLFGSSGSDNCMIRITAVLAALFFILSLALGNLSKNHDQKDNQLDIINHIQQKNKISQN